MAHESPTPGHSVIGCIHELLPVDDTPESLERLLRHECEECEGLRVVVDLTDQAVVDDRHVRIMIERLDPTGERWLIRLPGNVEPSVVEALEEAGFGAALISDEPA